MTDKSFATASRGEASRKGLQDIVELDMVNNIEVLADKTVVTLAFGKEDPLAEYLIGATRATLIRHGYPRRKSAPLYWKMKGRQTSPWNLARI